MKYYLPDVYTAEELAHIFRVDIQTIYRWLAAARRGESPFALPINSPGRRLLWSRKSIEEFIENSQSVNPLKHESPSKLRKRNEVAMAHIQKEHGRKLKKVRGE